MRTKFMQSLRFSAAIAMMFAVSVTFAQDAEPTGEQAVQPAKQTKTDRAEEKRLGRVWKTDTAVEGFESVEMFDAITAGDIEVVIKTKDASESNLVVTNNSNRHLAITLPPAFAALPVLKQQFGGGRGGQFGGGQFGGGGGRGGFGGGQGIGGGFGGGFGGGGFGGGGLGGGGFGGNRGGGGVFNIPPGRDGKVTVQTVCLEHGKPDPRPRMDYVVTPIEILSSDPKIAELCKMLASDEISQNVAQAAAWNVSDELSWDFLLTKNRVERMDGYFERYFTQQELVLAQQVVAETQIRADAIEAAPAQETTSTEEVSQGEVIQAIQGK